MSRNRTSAKAAGTRLERSIAGYLAGHVMHKRRGVADPGSQYVTTTVRDLVALLTGTRPN